MADRKWRVCWPCCLCLASDSPLGWKFLRDHASCRSKVIDPVSGAVSRIGHGGTVTMTEREMKWSSRFLRLAYTPSEELGSVGLEE